MIFLRTALEEREKLHLAPYAVQSSASEGRVYESDEDAYRTCFQRDRDRVIHSKAFRRLQEKTQVLWSQSGDHYRNRMIHSIECSQISRAIARTFGLNEDLAEAIALAHDLGHTPFGHAGEAAMDTIMKKFDLHFEHNEQSLRIVEKLEKMFPVFDGLNLTKEVLDGMLKHRTPFDRPKMAFVTSAHLEGQVVDLADEIAYTSADIDDGMRSGIFSFEDMKKVPLLAEILETVEKQFGHDIADEPTRSRISSMLMNRMVTDLSTESEKRLREVNIQTLADVRKFEGILIRFSPTFRALLDEVRQFLMKRFYFSPKVKVQNDLGQKIIEQLFEKYFQYPNLLPEKFQDLITAGERKEIVVKDYIAGMTDGFAENALAS